MGFPEVCVHTCQRNQLLYDCCQRYSDIWREFWHGGGMQILEQLSETSWRSELHGTKINQQFSVCHLFTVYLVDQKWGLAGRSQKVAKSSSHQYLYVRGCSYRMQKLAVFQEGMKPICLWKASSLVANRLKKTGPILKLGKSHHGSRQ